MQTLAPAETAALSRSELQSARRGSPQPDDGAQYGEQAGYGYGHAASAGRLRRLLRLRRRGAAGALAGYGYGQQWGGVPVAKKAVAGAGGYARQHAVKQRRQGRSRPGPPPPPPEPEYATPEEKLAFSRKPREPRARAPDEERIAKVPPPARPPAAARCELRGQREARERMKDYAEVMNKANMERAPPARPARPRRRAGSPPSPPAAATRALEYASQVPKPKQRARAEEGEAEEGTGRREEEGDWSGWRRSTGRTRRAVEAIRRELQGPTCGPSPRRTQRRRRPVPRSPLRANDAARAGRRGPASEGSSRASRRSPPPPAAPPPPPAAGPAPRPPAPRATDRPSRL
eukprot:tig00001501_g9227.t1